MRARALGWWLLLGLPARPSARYNQPPVANWTVDAGSDLERYFAIAERVWSDPESTGAKCLEVQRRLGWKEVLYSRDRRGNTHRESFVSMGTEGAGHHWLASMPYDACALPGEERPGEKERCGGLGAAPASLVVAPPRASLRDRDRTTRPLGISTS